MRPDAASTPSSTPAEFLRPRAAAEFLSISYPHLRALMKRGEGPPSARLGHARVFSVASLREFMKARESK